MNLPETTTEYILDFAFATLMLLVNPITWMTVIVGIYIFQV